MERWIREHETYFPQLPRNPQCPDDAQDFRYSARLWLEEKSGVQTRRIHDIMHGRYEFTPLDRADSLLVAMEQQHTFYTGEVEVLWKSSLGERAETQSKVRQERAAKVQIAIRRIAEGDDPHVICYELKMNISNLRSNCARHGVKFPKLPRGGKTGHKRFMTSVFGSDAGRPKGIDDPKRYKQIAEFHQAHGTSKAAQAFDLDRSTIRRIVRKVKEYQLV
jgi:hypothetical protein